MKIRKEGEIMDPPNTIFGVALIVTTIIAYLSFRRTLKRIIGNGKTVGLQRQYFRKNFYFSAAYGLIFTSHGWYLAGAGFTISIYIALALAYVLIQGGGLINEAEE